MCILLTGIYIIEKRFSSLLPALATRKYSNPKGIFFLFSLSVNPWKHYQCTLWIHPCLDLCLDDINPYYILLMGQMAARSMTMQHVTCHALVGRAWPRFPSTTTPPFIPQTWIQLNISENTLLIIVLWLFHMHSFSVVGCILPLSAWLQITVTAWYCCIMVTTVHWVGCAYLYIHSLNMHQK